RDTRRLGSDRLRAMSRRRRDVEDDSPTRSIAELRGVHRRAVGCERDSDQRFSPGRSSPQLSAEREFEIRTVVERLNSSMSGP
ncbi:MAG: hypothetical protein QOH10_2207, partial [Actinomycetota bacterium]|nr:hypothetical protein [Actinomycetota bacterium]